MPGTVARFLVNFYATSSAATEQPWTLTCIASAQCPRGTLPLVTSAYTLNRDLWSTLEIEQATDMTTATAAVAANATNTSIAYAIDRFGNPVFTTASLPWSTDALSGLPTIRG